MIGRAEDKEKLMSMRKAYLLPFDVLSSLEEFGQHLTDMLNSGMHIQNGQMASEKETVEKLERFRIEVRIREHTPPHFHAVSGKDSASFRIDNGELLESSGLKPKEIRKIKDWFMSSKDTLIEVWNKTRPDDCPVGKIHLS
ncbi:MAG: DUF4160 domain-containing protein [Campylobacterales bacterium]